MTGGGVKEKEKVANGGTQGLAKARIEKLERSSPGEYLIIDQMTGHKVCLILGIFHASQLSCGCVYHR
jgi:hypothetical protein